MGIDFHLSEGHYEMKSNTYLCRLGKILPALILALLLGGCSAPKDISYFQDATFEYDKSIPVVPQIRVENGDKLSIIVQSRDPKIAALFNLPIYSYRAGTAEGSLTTQELSFYTVDRNGDIDFPVLGKLHVAGKTRSEISSLVKSELIARDLVKDPVVTVEFGNLFISVVGEVQRPGRFNIDQDQVTVLDAIGLAGDLTIYGKRDNVVVIREINGKKHAFKLDLTDTKKIFESPAYYLHQRDVVYVEPNSTKARQATAIGNSFLQPGFWISLASLLTSVAVLIWK